MSGKQDIAIAFFGATGGCTLAVLVKALQAGYRCSALVRSPSKLAKFLAEKGVPEQTQDDYLRVVTGSSTDVATVQATLRTPEGQLASFIVSGVGGAPKLWPNPLKPTLDQPTICQDSMEAVKAAIKNIRATDRTYAPYVVAISTTGVDASVDDVPWLMHPLYHWLLPIPHADKRLMEEAVYEGAKDGIFSHYTVIRPSLLTDGASCYDVLRAGYSGRIAEQGDRWNTQQGEAIGYTVSRSDVGAFIFEELVHERGQGEWIDKKVTLTY